MGTTFSSGWGLGGISLHGWAAGFRGRRGALLPRKGEDWRAARTACQPFFAHWPDADPDLPVRKQAKVEFAKLR